MLKRLKAILILLFSVATIACSSNTIKKDFAFKDEPEKGVLLGSITYYGSYSEYGVYYREVSGVNSGYVSIGESASLIPIVSFLSAEIEDKGKKGETFGVVLKPGIYEFYAWKVSSAGIDTLSEKPFSLKVEVKPGAATYIGNFSFTQTASMGLTVTGASVEFSNMASRDLKIINSKYENISAINSSDDDYRYDVGENSLSGKEFFLKAVGEAVNNPVYYYK